MKYLRIALWNFMLIMLLSCSVEANQQKEQDYARLLTISNAMTFPFYNGPSMIHGIDLSAYGYHTVLQYHIASQDFMMVMLGLTESRELLLGMLDLTERKFSTIIKFSSEDTRNMINFNLHVGICFLNHEFSKERLRYIFLTHTRGGTNIYLRVYRMENDEPSTFTEMVQQMKIGGPDEGVPANKIASKVLMADVNHDKFMDIVLWRHILTPKPDPEYAGIPEYVVESEDIQVMFFDWEQISFSEPVTMPTTSLGSDLWWQVLFPHDWEQQHEAWREAPVKPSE